MPLDAATDEERASLASGLYGLLYSETADRPVMAIDYRTAAGVLRLEADCRTGTGGTELECLDDELLARLVCDEIVLIEGTDGRFHGGVEAYQDLFGASLEEQQSLWGDSSAVLAHYALVYAALLGGMDAAALAQRLYRFNGTPRDIRWDEKLADEEGREWLGLASVTADTSFNKRYARYEPLPENDDVWYRWRSRSDTIPSAPRYKIYISVRPDFLPEALQVAVKLCSRLDIPALKVGRGLRGILRPDHCVLYFHDVETLRQTAFEVHEALHGLPALGVPFTATIVEGSLLLSWGVDPPHQVAAGRPGANSWRLWLTHVLGAAMARTAALKPDQRIAFSLQRVRLEGVDVERWLAPPDW